MLKQIVRSASVALAILAVALSAPVLAAQKTPGTIKAESASKFPANGKKLVTAPDVNNSFQDVADSFIPILSTNSNCFWKANGASPATCEVAAGTTDASLLTSGTLNAARLPGIVTRNDTASTFAAQKIFTVVPRLPLTGYVKANGVGGDPTASSTIPAADLSGTLDIARLPTNQPWTDATTVIGSAEKFHQTNFFGNSASGKVSRFNRILVGASALTSGDRPDTSAIWTDTYIPNWNAISQLSATSAIGGLAVTGASRTSDFRTWVPGSPSGGSQGVTGLAVNDDALGGAIACPICGQGVQAVATGITLNQLDVGSLVETANTTPYGGVVGNTAYSLGLSPGVFSSIATHNITAALYIGASAATGTKFKKGIIVYANPYSLDTSQGESGGGVAVELARPMEIRWLSSADARDASLFASLNTLNVLSTYVKLSNTLSDATTKTGIISVAHYTNATNPTALIFGSNSSTNNDIFIGGGTASLTASTGISLYTASTNAVSNGTKRWEITNLGHMLPGAASSYDVGSAALPLRNIFLGNYFDVAEMTPPAAPAANGARLYCDDNGAGKTRCSILFATGAAQQIAIEP